FHPLFWKFIGHLRGNITLLEPFGGRLLPIQEKIFLGGPNTIRGFRNFSISPIDPATGGRLGGSKAFFTNAELIFPITALSFLDLKGVVFFDAGNVFDDDFQLSFRTSAGLGVRLRTPLAPIRVEWGYNLSPKPGESSSQFHFTVGTVF
ncbi:MAG: BamA/TamA family outer membrane protein, partial [Candidatus Methylomirabilales bacterium]